jgi:nitroreductase/NAD-dependent dihydropyrimidine dehydrogenase PreA subunit
MKVLGIDQEKCLKCGECIKECGFGLFKNSRNDQNQIISVRYEDNRGDCIGCGHCVARCPVNAIEITDTEDIFEFDEAAAPASLATYESIMKILRARRSIRFFQDKAVSEEDIAAVLEACRFAPTAHNNQQIRYTVLTDSNKILSLREMSTEYVKSLMKKLKLAKIFRFLLPKDIRKEVLKPSLMEGLMELVDLLDRGEDEIFYNAPVVIIAYTSMFGSIAMAGAEIGIALTHGMLAAQSLGLGTCWIGFAQEALNTSKMNKKRLGIPKNMIVAGVLILGHPKVQYYRAPPRNPLQVVWNPQIN